MIVESRRTISAAVAAGMIRIAFTSTIPIAFSATTTATAIITSSAYWKNDVRTPIEVAIAGS